MGYGHGTENTPAVYRSLQFFCESGRCYCGDPKGDVGKRELTKLSATKGLSKCARLFTLFLYIPSSCFPIPQEHSYNVKKNRLETTRNRIKEYCL